MVTWKVTGMVISMVTSVVSGVVTSVNGELLWWVRHSSAMRSPLTAAQHGPSSSPGSHLDALTCLFFWTQPCFSPLATRWPKLVVPWKSFEPQAANWNWLARKTETF